MVYQLPLKMMLLKNMQLHGEMFKRTKQEKIVCAVLFQSDEKNAENREIHQMFRVAASVCCNYG